MYRKNIIREADVENQLSQISQEKEVLSKRVKDIERLLSKESSPLSKVDSVEKLLVDLRKKIEGNGSDFETKREIVRLLVHNVEVESFLDENNRLQGMVHVKYAFFKDDLYTVRGSWRRQR